jgi:hypothetical protein
MTLPAAKAQISSSYRSRGSQPNVCARARIFAARGFRTSPRSRRCNPSRLMPVCRESSVTESALAIRRCLRFCPLNIIFCLVGIELPPWSAHMSSIFNPTIFFFKAQDFFYQTCVIFYRISYNALRHKKESRPPTKLKSGLMTTERI